MIEMVERHEVGKVGTVRVDVDRRVRRTRRLLQQALHALILEKGYDRVSVQNVLDRADVARATFYAHFRDKDDLLLESFEALWDVARPAVAAFAAFAQAEFGPAISSAPLAPTRALVHHVLEHQPLYRAVTRSRAGSLVLTRVQERFAALVREHLREMTAGRSGAPTVPMDAAAQFVVCGLLGVLTWWLDSDTPYPADQLAAHCERLMAPVVDAAVGPER